MFTWECHSPFLESDKLSDTDTVLIWPSAAKHKLPLEPELNVLLDAEKHDVCFLGG